MAKKTKKFELKDVIMAYEALTYAFSLPSEFDSTKFPGFKNLASDGCPLITYKEMPGYNQYQIAFIAGFYVPDYDKVIYNLFDIKQLLIQALNCDTLKFKEVPKPVF